MTTLDLVQRCCFADRPLSRRDLLRLSAGQLLTLGLWPGALRAEGAGNAGDFSFIAVNDLHYLDAHCGEWFQQVVRQMNATPGGPAFCLIIGDYAEHGTLAQMGACREVFQKLVIPSHGVIGNHDYVTGADRVVYEKLFPKALNYCFEHQGWQFIGLDTTEGRKASGTTIQPATLQWLDNHLPKLDKKRPTVIFTHFPMGPFTPARPANADRLLERFLDFNLRAVFNGHFHGFTERFVGETTLTTNQCCAISRANHDGSKEKGYFLCEARAGSIKRRFVEVKPA